MVGGGVAGLVIASADAGQLRATSPAEAKPGDAVAIALRPEKVRITQEPPVSAGENCVAGQVWDIGYLGDLSIYKVRLDNGFIQKATVANMRRLVERPMGGDDVWLSWAPEGRGADAMSTGRHQHKSWGARVVVLIAFAWLAVFFLVPFLIVLKISLSPLRSRSRPEPVFDPAAGWASLKAFLSRAFVREFAFIASDWLYLGSYLKRPRVSPRSRRFCCCWSVSARLWHCARAKAVAAGAVHAGSAAVLDLVPDPHLCLDQHSQRDGLLNQVLLALRIVDEPPAGSRPIPPSISASSIPTCRSWCCRSTPRWKDG